MQPTGGDLTKLVEATKAAMERLNFRFFDGEKAFDLNLVSVRMPPLVADQFDDVMIELHRDGYRAWGGNLWRITTDPGKAWLESPMRETGCFVLAPGQRAGVYVRGLHKGRPALVASGPLPGWRDNDRDHELDPVRLWREHVADPTRPAPPISLGDAINIHNRGGAKGPLVGLGSAGCQVFEVDADHAELLRLADLQAKNGKGWDRYTYTLVDVVQAPELADLVRALMAA